MRRKRREAEGKRERRRHVETRIGGKERVGDGGGMGGRGGKEGGGVGSW